MLTLVLRSLRSLRSIRLSEDAAHAERVRAKLCLTSRQRAVNLVHLTNPDTRVWSGSSESCDLYLLRCCAANPSISHLSHSYASRLRCRSLLHFFLKPTIGDLRTYKAFRVHTENKTLPCFALPRDYCTEESPLAPAHVASDGEIYELDLYSK
jgi:hypothetical protein